MDKNNPFANYNRENFFKRLKEFENPKTEEKFRKKLTKENIAKIILKNIEKKGYCTLDCIIPKLVSTNSIKADEYTRIANEFFRENINEILEENNLIKAKTNAAARQKILMTGGVKTPPKYSKTLYMNKDFIE